MKKAVLLAVSVLISAQAWAGSLSVDEAASAVNGATVFRDVSFTEEVVKASAGKVYGFHMINANAAARYLQLYNKATTPANGTDTPVAVFRIPATGSLDVRIQDVGQQFDTGIGVGCTTDAAGATDATAAECILGALWYK